MRDRGRVRHQPLAAHAGAPHLGPERSDLRDEHADEVREGAPRDEEPPRSRREPEEIRRPADDLLLDLDGGVIAAAEIGV